MEEEPNPCKIHDDDECTICDSYEMSIDWGHGPRMLTWWVGQNAGMDWGTFGDGLIIIFRPGVV